MNIKLDGNTWEIVEETTNIDEIISNETILSLSNGYFGTRGSIEEAVYTVDYPGNQGSYINGFFEKWPINYAEEAFGYAKSHQTICQVPNSKLMWITVDNEKFNLWDSKVLKHKRTFDMKNCLLRREFKWETSSGKIVEVLIERIVHEQFSGLLLQRYLIKPMNFSGTIDIEMMINSDFRMEESVSKEMDQRVAKRDTEFFRTETIIYENTPMMIAKTINSELGLIVAEQSKEEFECQKEISLTDNSISTKITFEGEEGSSYDLTRYVLHSEVSSSENIEATQSVVEKTLKQYHSSGFSDLKKIHESALEEFWENSDVIIEGDEVLQKGLRFNLLQLYSSAGRNGKTNIAAKGLSGDGYEGHYFWDTEMYMLPFFVYTQPKIARSLLEYRYSILDKARDRAKELSVNSGALFPWRTIDGSECSAYYPAGTAQVHINADIAYGVRSYLEASDDEEFKYGKGLEILIETARFYNKYGSNIHKMNNKFCINGVTGPDEYTAIVNNNYYTNSMAKFNLMYAAQVVKEAQKQDLGLDVLTILQVTQDEVSTWETNAKDMYLAYDEELQITLQDDAFLNREKWDFINTPKENYPLLLHYHPMIIYRHQVLKQADVLIAHLLDLNEISVEQKKMDFDFYEPITTHDSSLSKSVYGIVASDIGEHDKAYKYFMDVALMDLKDGQGNTADGIHAANMGGTWMSLVYGFAGMKIQNGIMTFNPMLPKQWKGLQFKINFKGRLLNVKITKDSCTYLLLRGEDITVRHFGEDIQLEAGVSMDVLI